MVFVSARVRGVRSGLITQEPSQNFPARRLRDLVGELDDPDVLVAATNKLSEEIAALEGGLAKADQWDRTRIAKMDAVETLADLAVRAKENMAWPTLELMKEVFDLLEVRVLVAPDGLKISGTLPIDAWGEPDDSVSELGTGVPRAPSPRPPLSGRGAVGEPRGPDL